jgi:hypothetical protein
MRTAPVDKTSNPSSAPKRPDPRRLRRALAAVLLERAGISTDGRPVLTLSGIAAHLNTDPVTVNMALELLLKYGAIRLEHQRIVIDRDLLGQLAGRVI